MILFSTKLQDVQIKYQTLEAEKISVPVTHNLHTANWFYGHASGLDMLQCRSGALRRTKPEILTRQKRKKNRSVNFFSQID